MPHQEMGIDNLKTVLPTLDPSILVDSIVGRRIVHSVLMYPRGTPENDWSYDRTIDFKGREA